MKFDILNSLAFQPFKVQEILEALNRGFSLIDLLEFCVSCILIWAIYIFLKQYSTNPKSLAWLITMQSSFIFSICGSFHAFNTILYDAWSIDAIYTENPFSRFLLIYFTAANFMDIVIGMHDYPKYLDPLTAIAHHIVYNLFMLVLLSHHYANGFILCFLMEIPTFLLAIGTFNKHYRSDSLFGMSFFLTRIVYNIYFANRLRLLSPNGYIWKFCCCVLMLHVYWFSKWFKVYGSKIMEDNKLKGGGLITCTTLN